LHFTILVTIVVCTRTPVWSPSAALRQFLGPCAISCALCLYPQWAHMD
jgi:hypothetical protein